MLNLVPTAIRSSEGGDDFHKTLWLCFDREHDASLGLCLIYLRHHESLLRIDRRVLLSIWCWEYQEDRGVKP